MVRKREPWGWVGAVILVVVLAVLSGCGGGSGRGGGVVQPPTASPAPEPVARLSLPAWWRHGLTSTEPITIAAGTQRRSGNVLVRCPFGGEVCVLVGATYRLTGGTPTVAAAWNPLNVAGLGGDLGLTGTEWTTIEAGDTERIGNVNVTCPADGLVCVVLGATYAATGGIPTVARPAVPEPEPLTEFPPIPEFTPTPHTSADGVQWWGHYLTHGYFGMSRRPHSANWNLGRWPGEVSGDAPVGPATYHGGMVGFVADRTANVRAKDWRVSGTAFLRYENRMLDVHLSRITAVDGHELDLTSLAMNGVEVNADGTFNRYRTKRRGVPGYEEDFGVYGSFTGPEHQEVMGNFRKDFFYGTKLIYGTFGARFIYGTFGARPQDYSRNNPTAEDLRDHWNDPAPVRSALALWGIPETEEPGRKADLSSLLATAPGKGGGIGTRLRNVSPDAVTAIGVSGGITYGQWKGGPAGTMNIEFRHFAGEPDRLLTRPLTAGAALKARIERAGKAWSYRLLDDFEPTPLPSELVSIDPHYADDLLIDVYYAGDYDRSSAGWRRARKTETDFEPWFGIIRQAEGDHSESARVIAHEIGHVLGHSMWEGSTPPSSDRYVNREDHTFEGPNAMAANGGKPIPFQWLDEHRKPVAAGGEVDYGHLGICEMIMAYCRRPRDLSTPHELDLAVLADIGYDILDAETASQPELYGYGAWGRWSAWGVGVERSLDWERQRDTFGASADAFGVSPAAALGESELSGQVRWTGTLLGVDTGNVKLPPVFGGAELAVDLATLTGVARFDNLRSSTRGVLTDFRAPSLAYDISVDGNSFSDEQDRVSGGFFGPSHEEMAGVLDDRAINLLAGFGGERPVAAPTTFEPSVSQYEEYGKIWSTDMTYTRAGIAYMPWAETQWETDISLRTSRAGHPPVGRAVYQGHLVGAVYTGKSHGYEVREGDQGGWSVLAGDARLTYENLNMDADFYGIRALDGTVLDKTAFSIEDIRVHDGTCTGGVTCFREGGAFYQTDFIRGEFAGPNQEEVVGSVSKTDFHNGRTLWGAFGAEKQ